MAKDAENAVAGCVVLSAVGLALLISIFALTISFIAL